MDPAHGDLITRAGESGAGRDRAWRNRSWWPDAEIKRPALNDAWVSAGLDELLPEGMSRSEMILRCTLSHPQCDTTIVGTCNHQHLAENIAAAIAGPLPEELQAEVAARVSALG